MPPGPLHESVYVLLCVSAPVDCVPLVALLPDHPPEAAQAVALAVDHAKVALPPEGIVLGAALIVTVGAGVVTKTVADCVAVPPIPWHVNV